jgi:hypothetical protein
MSNRAAPLAGLTSFTGFNFMDLGFINHMEHSGSHEIRCLQTVFTDDNLKGTHSHLWHFDISPTSPVDDYIPQSYVTVRLSRNSLPLVASVFEMWRWISALL